MGDPLFMLRNYYLIGAYNAAINEASDLDGLPGPVQVEKDAYVYRSYIELGSHDLVINEIADTAPIGLRAVKLLAQARGGALPAEACLATLAEWREGDLAGAARDPHVLLVAGALHAAGGNHVEALKACNAGPQSLEMMALCVQCYLLMDRVDRAEAQAKAMSARDDDATATQLAAAWVGAELGGAKVQEACYIYQELGDKYTWTPPLHNGLAVCRMKMGEWEDAERDLLDALAKDPRHADTLANLAVVAPRTGKSAARHLAQLKAVAPAHPSVAALKAAEEAFERAEQAVH